MSDCELEVKVDTWWIFAAVAMVMIILGQWRDEDRCERHGGKWIIAPGCHKNYCEPRK